MFASKSGSHPHSYPLVASLLVLILSAAAGAQEEPAAEDTEARRPSSRIEEIIVTAEKRETLVQDTPVAISAFSGVELDRSGVENIEDLAFTVPNFHYGRTLGGPVGGGGGITIRGVSSAGGDRATAFHADGVYQNAPGTLEGLTFFDIQRVEVLRGPQGTLYGRNATGGSINVISNPPTDELEGAADFQYGSYDQIRTRGFLNAPFIGERVLTRFSFFQEDRDGYQRNLETSSRRNDADDAREFGFRQQVRFLVSDDAELTVRGSYGRRGGVGPSTKVIGDYPSEIYLDPDLPPLDLYDLNGAKPNPSNSRKVRYDFIADRREVPWTVNGTFDWSLYDLPVLGDTKVTVIASHTQRKEHQSTDGDFADIPLLVVDYDDHTREYVGEARLASNGDGDLEWVVGVFYLNSKEDLTVNGRSFPFSSNPPQPGALELTTSQLTDRDAWSTAVFGQASYTLWDDWRFTGGLRYSYDYKKASFDAPPVFLFPGDEDPFIPGTMSDDSDHWGAVTGKFGLDWFWRDGSMAYLSISRGYKAGTIEVAPRLDPDTGAPTGGSIANADPEFIWAYEVGSKNRFFDDRLQFNMTGFYYDYSDLQVVTLAENVFVTQNAAEATIWGFEWEITALPWPELLLVANVSYLNATFDKFIGFREEDRFQTPVDFSGNQLPRAPEYSLNLAAAYTFDFDDWGALTPRVQFYLSDDVYFRAANDSTDKQDMYTKTDLRLTWQSADEHFTVEAFVENLTDEDVIQSQIIGTSLTGWPLTTAFDEPRTAGFRVGYHFGT